MYVCNIWLCIAGQLIDFHWHLPWLIQSENGTQLYEMIGLEGEINLAVERLADWAAPRPVEKNLLTISDEVFIQPEPLGVVLIIGAWNYPWAVTLQPLIGAIAAGEVFREYHLLVLWRILSSSPSHFVQTFTLLYMCL